VQDTDASPQLKLTATQLITLTARPAVRSLTFNVAIAGFCPLWDMAHFFYCALGQSFLQEDCKMSDFLEGSTRGGGPYCSTETRFERQGQILGEGCNTLLVIL
jgi:hypothetical protein